MIYCKPQTKSQPAHTSGPFYVGYADVPKEAKLHFNLVANQGAANITNFQ